MNKPSLIGGAAVLLGLMTQAFGAAAPRCSTLFEDAQRLACYDAQFGKPVPVPAPSSVARVEAPAAPKPREEIVTSKITDVDHIANGRFVVTLDNGQVWSQLERDSSVEVLVGDTVKIRPAMLGSWMLETRGGVRTRVRSVR